MSLSSDDQTSRHTIKVNSVYMSYTQTTAALLLYRVHAKHVQRGWAIPRRSAKRGTTGAIRAKSYASLP